MDSYQKMSEHVVYASKCVCKITGLSRNMLTQDHNNSNTGVGIVWEARDSERSDCDAEKLECQKV